MIDNVRVTSREELVNGCLEQRRQHYGWISIWMLDPSYWDVFGEGEIMKLPICILNSYNSYIDGGNQCFWGCLGVMQLKVKGFQEAHKHNVASKDFTFDQSSSLNFFRNYSPPHPQFLIYWEPLKLWYSLGESPSICTEKMYKYQVKVSEKKTFCSKQQKIRVLVLGTFKWSKGPDRCEIRL